MSVRVLVDATTWWNDRGFGRYTKSLLSALAARGRLEYTFLIDRPDDGTLPKGVGVISSAPKRTLTESAVQDGFRSLPDLVRVAVGALGAAPDVVFFPTVYSFAPLPVPAPFVVGIHDTTAERLPRLVFPSRHNELLWKAKVSLARRMASRFLTVSEASAAAVALELGVPRDRIDVVYGAPDPVFRVIPDRSKGRADFGFAENSALFVYVGGLNPHKNVLGLLAAFEALLETHPSSELAIVGDNSRRGFYDNVLELESHVSAHPALAAQVKFLGRVADEPLAELMNDATALVFPSFSEGFGLPAVEAMACGLPVLASGVTSLPEIIGGAGILFDPANSSEIHQAMRRVLEDPELRSDLRARGLRRAGEFTWARSAERAETMLERSAATGRSPARCLVSSLRSAHERG